MVKTKSRISQKSKAIKAINRNRELLYPSMTLIATTAMKAAIEACEAKVDAIVTECLENNCKFRDQNFDLLGDSTNCLYSSSESTSEYMFYGIDGSKRVGDLFRNPVFFLNGATPDDIKQGAVGDCWFMAALGVVSNIPGLLERLCVKRNEEVGVYGFIFFKDGDWVSTVVDDQLFYRMDRQSFKNKLYFGSCSNENETWLPLMEKAYAKIHGDYESISGGFTAEGIEDLTGGIATMIYGEDILSKDRFWEEAMKPVNQSHMLGCFISHVEGDGILEKHGIQSGHAYSVLRVAEYQGERLVQVRNPWGTVEWNGDWSDQSEKWTPEAKKLLNFKDDDDGQFWMSFKDFMRKFTAYDVCRIFDSTWSVASNWIRYNVVPRSSGKYEYTTKKGGETVIVLTQPDTRYFGALAQSYEYTLSFHVYDKDKKLIKRSRKGFLVSQRSVSCEVKLHANSTYTVIPYITRTAVDLKSVQDELAELESKGNIVLPSQGIGNFVVDKEPVKISMDDYIFKQRKAKSIQTRSIARLKGNAFLDDDDDFALEIEDLKKELWQLTIGLRVYSHDGEAKLEGIAGKHPKETGVVEKKSEDDPESVTATLADKKDEKEVAKDEVKKATEAKAEKDASKDSNDKAEVDKDKDKNKETTAKDSAEVKTDSEKTDSKPDSEKTDSKTDGEKTDSKADDVEAATKDEKEKVVTVDEKTKIIGTIDGDERIAQKEE